MSYQRNRNIAIRRLKRDLIELQRANIASIAAQPLDNNIFEWHVNIKPTDGVYSGVYFHCILRFPNSYPTNPPKVEICTRISHPNVFDGWICLSMLRPHTKNVPYEGWSGAYSVTSILMQLQSFLYADKIEQDGGYQVKAYKGERSVNRSIKVCREFVCNKCSHSHHSPWPLLKVPANIKVYSSNLISPEYWVGFHGNYGCRYDDKIKVFYETYISEDQHGLLRIGYGTEDSLINQCGSNEESFGYEATGNYWYNNKSIRLFRKDSPFTKGDIITVAIEFPEGRIYLAKNGELLRAGKGLCLPAPLRNKVLYPLVSCRDAGVKFNFGAPKKPCLMLIDQGFHNLEYAFKLGRNHEYGNVGVAVEDIHSGSFTWHNHGVIHELWVWIFECLEVPEIFNAQFTCKKWYELINRYNIMERNEISCYYTKDKLGQAKSGKVLGIGLTLKPKQNGYGGYDFNSQMDILSHDAWFNGCKIGVWGESLTHFLPLVINKEHAKIADIAIHQYLEKIKITLDSKDKGYSNRNPNKFDNIINSNKCLQLIDTLITMMNQIVVQFVMNNQNTNINNVTMIMCEKVVLGYCALHHLLLYLAKKYKTVINNYANLKVSSFIESKDGRNKNMCKDLGKFLIYLMISTQYSWTDVCSIFIKEVFTRNVRWMVQDEKYTKYDTTDFVHGRLNNTFIASKISRRLVMFQVWFMKNNANETLKDYNQRLGRPRIQIRNAIVGKTKYILSCKSWQNYFDELGIIIKDNKAIDQLLRFAVYNSKKNGYHYRQNRGLPLKALPINGMKAPRIAVKGLKKDPSKRFAPAKVSFDIFFAPPKPSFDIKASKKESISTSSFKWGMQNNNNLRQSPWNNKGQQMKKPTQEQGKGKGFTPRQLPQNKNENQNQYSPLTTPGQYLQNGLHNNKQPRSVNNNNNNTKMPQRQRANGNEHYHQGPRQGQKSESTKNTMPRGPPQNMHQHPAADRVALTQQIYQQPATPSIRIVNGTNLNHANMGQRLIRPQQYQNTVNRNDGQNHIANQTETYQQQRTAPIMKDGNAHNSKMNATTETPKISNVPLCLYHRSATGCALGQRCNNLHENNVPFCEYYQTSQGCALGNLCNYRH